MDSTRTVPTLTDTVLDHLLSVTFEDLPARAVRRASTRLLDAVGQIAAGARASGSSALLEQVLTWGGAPESTAPTTAVRVPAMHAALCHAAFMRSYDFEPVGADRLDGAQIPAHITGTTAAVALAVAERERADGRELMRALVLGDDIAARVGHAVGFDVYGGGDNTGSINVVGGTVVAGLLMGLGRERLRHALGLAINQASGTIQNIVDKTTAFKLPIALAARNAVFSTDLATSGWNGPADPIGAPSGFLSQWAPSPDPDRITAGLGTEFFADAVIKPWPTCRASQAALDATAQLVRKYPVAPSEISSILVHVTPRTAAGFVGQEFDVEQVRTGQTPAEVAAIFSIPFAVATTALDGTVDLEHLSHHHITSPRFLNMLTRVHVVPDLPEGPVKASVELTTTDGDARRQDVVQPLGDIHFTPQEHGRVVDKFRRSIAWAGGAPPVADHLLEILQDPSGLQDITPVIEALTVPVGRRSRGQDSRTPAED